MKRASPPHSDREEMAEDQKNDRAIVQRNQVNARSSTGPRTEVGRQRSRANAVRHGVFAQAVVLDDPDSGDTEDAFRALHAALVADLQPTGELEALIVERITVLHWRLRRVYRAEVGEISEARESAAWAPLELDANRADEVRRIGTFGTGIGAIVSSPMALAIAQELIAEATAEVEEAGSVSQYTRARLARIWGMDKGGFTEAIIMFSSDSHADNPALPPEQRTAALRYALNAERQRLSALKAIAEERRDVSMAARAEAALVPPALAANRLVRYEAHLERVLARALEQLDRLQRGRRGEQPPPTLRVERRD